MTPDQKLKLEMTIKKSLSHYIGEPLSQEAMGEIKKMALEAYNNFVMVYDLLYTIELKQVGPDELEVRFVPVNQEDQQ
jgi:hypothetical protein